MTTDVLFLGLDGAEPGLIRQWADQGELPVLGGLLRNGWSADLATPPGFGDGVFWATLYTGCNAGRHGHYFPWQFDSRNYGIASFPYDTHFRRDPFWMYASKMGRRVGIIDLYTSPLVQGMNGIQVMDWMIHDRTGDPRSWPEAVIGALQEKYMTDPLQGNSETRGRTEVEWVAFHQAMLDRLAAKTRAMVDMVGENRWDLFAGNWCDAHDGGHQSWHWHDPAAPAHDPEFLARNGDPLLAIYRALDDGVGQVMDAACARQVFVTAGLGMGIQTTCNPACDELLAHFSGHAFSRAELADRRHERPYFALPHNMNAGAVRINLKGREALGVVDREDYGVVCRELAERFLEVSDAATGLPVVAEVLRVDEVYQGAHAAALPDLMIIWQRDRPVYELQVPGRENLAVKPVSLVEQRSGDHTPHAMLFSNSPWHDPVPRTDKLIETEAIAPTICHSLGIRMPGTDRGPLLPESDLGAGPVLRATA